MVKYFDPKSKDSPYWEDGVTYNMFTQQLPHLFDVGDYFELWMWGNDTGIKLDAIAAVAANPGVTPAIPACPSIILTANFTGVD